MYTTQVFVACVLSTFISTSLGACTRSIKCPCGTSNTFYTFCLDDNPRVSNPCERLSNCESCQNGLDRCLTCPQGFSGPTCSKDDGVLLRTITRLKRQVSRGNRCPELETPELVSISCWTSGDERRCTGTCAPGHSFSGYGDQKEIVLLCQRGSWSPMSSFPSCESEGYCKLQMSGAGAYNCTTSDKGTWCDIQCNARYSRYFCYPGNGWDPPLPRCIKELEKGAPPPRENVYPSCPCQNNGACDSEGECICPIGFTGRICDRERAPPPREDVFQTCPCRNGGACDSEGECICRSGFIGRLCETAPNTDDDEVYCENPGLVTDGQVTIISARNERRRLNTNEPPLPDGTRLQYSCNEGFSLDGDPMITCEEGIWSVDTLPFCTRGTSG